MSPLVRLASLFFLCFFLPVILFFFLINSTGKEDLKRPSRLSGLSGFIFGSEGQYFELPDSTGLLPDETSDFMLTIWLRFRRLPRVGDRVVLASQWDPGLPEIPGYALAVKHEDGFLRPQVYWRGNEGQGRWYEFPGLALLPQRWCGLVLSHHKGRYIGLHVINDLAVRNEYRVTLLGSHILEAEVAPSAPGFFRIGSNSAGRNRLEIGPVGIFKNKELHDSFEKILSELRENISGPPASVPVEGLLFWSSDLKKDLSPAKRKIIFHSGGGS